MARTIETARERARREITVEILDEAKRQLASDGAAGLSLRAVARELGMASSAIYRYFKSRDDLLTVLIVEAYDDLGSAAEAAAASAEHPFDRWMATCRAIRAWAVAHPHQYALIFGTPVPGYAAPEYTTDAGTRASRALIGILQDAWVGDALRRVSPAIPDGLEDDLDAVAGIVGFDGPKENLLAAIAAWSQLYGLVSFELFGQTRGMTRDDAALFSATTRFMAEAVGLMDSQR